MPTNAEVYGHSEMSNKDLEKRIAADLYELSIRLEKNESTKWIGHLLWTLMRKIREAYRTAEEIEKGG